MANRVCGFVLLFLNSVIANASFRFEDCSVSDSVVDISEFSVLPDPVDMTKNLTISLRGGVRSDIPPTARLEVKYYRTRQVFGVQLDLLIPCVRGKYGSCTFPLCEYMDRFRAQVCPFLSSEGACECPPKQGTYSRDEVEIEMATTNAIGRFIAKGKYRTEMRLKDGNSDTDLACFKFYTELM